MFGFGFFRMERLGEWEEVGGKGRRGHLLSRDHRLIGQKNPKESEEETEFLVWDGKERKSVVGVENK